MRHMTKYTFTRPLTHSEIVALAIRSWPMPCGISIVKPLPFDPDCHTPYRRPTACKHFKGKFGRKRFKRRRP